MEIALVAKPCDCRRLGDNRYIHNFLSVTRPEDHNVGQGILSINLKNLLIDCMYNNNNNNNNNKGNEKGTCMLIDVAISGDRNVIKKEAEKILKYKDLTIEIQHMWNVKARVILVPVIIGATGTVSKSFRKHVSNIPGHHDVKELQKTAILGTAPILRKVLT